MKAALLVIMLWNMSELVMAQAGADLAVYKFDFGTGRAAKGYIKVTPETIYNERTGYGFHPGSNITAVVRRKSKAITSDFVTSDQPFFFSVNLPDGNYDVKVILGDVKGTSATTVRAECRRLMLNNVCTERRQIIKQTFTVHKRDSIIRSSQAGMLSRIRLRPHEAGYLHWDNMLTLEFNDSLPKVCGLEIRPNNDATTIFLTGNSTVVDQAEEPWAAWGQMLPGFFQAGTVVVANYAEAGETLLAFKAEKRLDKIWSMAKPGDYLFIEFGHNDEKESRHHPDPFTYYKAVLKEYITEARMRNLVPVLVTPMNGRTFDAYGQVVNSLGDYPEAMRQTAAEENVPLIDLHAMSSALYEALGPEESVKAFVHYEANTSNGQLPALKDDMHVNTYGAYQLARCVAAGIINAGLPVARYLLPEKLVYTPSKPDPIDQWYWPVSPVISHHRTAENW
jgi:Lysophospholipase L1 and related esterases